MKPQRQEGAVMVLLLAVSTVVAMVILSVCCIIGGRQYKLRQNEQIHADAWMQGVDVQEQGWEAQMSEYFA